MQQLFLLERNVVIVVALSPQFLYCLLKPLSWVRKPIDNDIIYNVSKRSRRRTRRMRKWGWWGKEQEGRGWQGVFNLTTKTPRHRIWFRGGKAKNWTVSASVLVCVCACVCVCVWLIESHFPWSIAPLSWVGNIVELCREFCSSSPILLFMFVMLT